MEKRLTSIYVEHRCTTTQTTRQGEGKPLPMAASASRQVHTHEAATSRPPTSSRTRNAAQGARNVATSVDHRTRRRWRQCPRALHCIVSCSPSTRNTQNFSLQMRCAVVGRSLCAPVQTFPLLRAPIFGVLAAHSMAVRSASDQRSGSCSRRWGGLLADALPGSQEPGTARAGCFGVCLFFLPSHAPGQRSRPP